MDTIVVHNKWFKEIDKECNNLYKLVEKDNYFDYFDQCKNYLQMEEIELKKYYDDDLELPNLQYYFVAYMLCNYDSRQVISVLENANIRPNWSCVLTYFICKLYKRLKTNPEFDFEPVINLLLSLDADITIFDNMAIKIASAINCPKLLQLLINHGADITVDNNYPICAAASYHAYDNVVFLESVGADIHVNDDYPFCTLFRNSNNTMPINPPAMRDIYDDQYCMDKMIDFFINHGTDPNVHNGYAINRCIYYSFPNLVPEFDKLIKYGADVSYINNNMLARTVRYGDTDIIKQFIEQGVDFSKLNYFDNKCNNNDTINKTKLLLDTGINADCLIKILLD